VSIKIRMYPTPEQKRTLIGWSHVTRLLYNEANALVKQSWHTWKSKYTLRDHLVNQRENPPDWMTAVPNAVRARAVFQLHNAYTTSFALHKSKDVRFRVHFRSRKKEDVTVMHFDKRSRAFSDMAVNARSIQFSLPKIDGRVMLRDSPAVIRLLEKLKKPPCDFLVQRHVRTKQWYLVLPMPLSDWKQARPDPAQDASARQDVVALDPGVRSFMTGYSPHGQVVEGPRHVNEVLQNTQDRIDRLKSVQSAAETPPKTKARLRRRIAKLGARWRATRAHFHKTLAKHLLLSYDTVLLPTFDTSQMTQRVDANGKRRRIGRGTTRYMLGLGHYQFKQSLLWKARYYDRPDAVRIVSEAHTSMTCGACGALHRSLGSNKTFTCPRPSCSYVSDRDVNAARNILIRFLSI
jgi:putative transposase